MREKIKNLFATKELYIRSQGAVKYITLTPVTQIAAAVGMVVFVGLMVTTMIIASFQDEIIAFRNDQLTDTVQSYEIRIAQLQATFDALESKHKLTQDWFKEVTNTLETRHNELTQIFEKNASVSAELQKMQARFADAAERVKRSNGETKIIASAIGNQSVAFESRVKTGVHDAARLTLSDNRNVKINQIASPDTVTDVPSNIRDRIARLTIRQQELLDALEESTDHKIFEARAIINATKTVTAEEYVNRIQPDANIASGGPFIPLDGDIDKSSPTYKQLLRITNNLEKLSNLNASMAKLPLAVPVHYYKPTSDFGPRIDPINKRKAFHAGLDFGAPSGTRVHATLPGRVIKAGNKGPYGLVVEIDHGNGFRTRYGHLKSIKVKRGEEIDFHDIIGTVGSSGRSTGPHLHYEVWYDGKVQDPSNFTKSGKYLFTNKVPDGS